MRRRSFLLALLPLLSRAESAERRGTWAATGLGRQLAGTWTANTGSDSSAAFGAWTLMDAAGRQIARGSWSARKAEGRWEGSWQARTSSDQIYTGTWTSRSVVAPSSRIADLFELALSSAVNGTWRAGRRSGAWSIRTSAAR